MSLDSTVNTVLDLTAELESEESDLLIYETLIKELEMETDCWRAEILTLLWKPEGQRLLSPVGHVNYSEHVNLFSDVMIFPNTKLGFNGREFVTTANEWLPFTKRLEKNGSVYFEGYAFDIFDVVATSLNFSYVYTEPDDRDWGIIKNGSWTGGIGQLARREVDVFVGPLAISSEREEVVDFTFPYFHVYTSVIFRRPDPNKFKWRKLIDPFKWEVHVCLYSSFFGIILMLYSIERLNPYYNAARDERPTFQGLVLYLFGALLNQGGSSMPASTAGRCMLAAWWIFCLITVATYSGNLIAFLTVSKEKLPFETLDQLGQQEDYKWGTLGGSIWISLIKDSNLTDFTRLWEKIEIFNETDSDVLSHDQQLHRQKVQSEDYGFIADKTTADNWILENCELTYLKELFFPMNYAFVLQNNSPYLQYISDEMMKISESGLVHQLKKGWWPKQNRCLESETVAKIIQLADLQSAFYVIGIGFSLAMICILVERCYTKNERGLVCKLPNLKQLCNK